MTAPAPITRRVSLQDLQRWADLSGDHNRLHVDPVFAAETRYGQPIAHGHLTICWLTTWAVLWQGVDFVRRGRIQGLRFLAPVLTDTDYEVGGVIDGQAATVEVRGPDGAVAVTARVELRAEQTGDPS